MVAIHLLFIRVNDLYIFIYCFNRKVKADGTCANIVKYIDAFKWAK